MNRHLFERIYNHVFSIGPNCITSYLVRSVPKIAPSYNQDFITHFKVYKNIDSTIFFIENMLNLSPKFKFELRLNNLKEISNDVDATFYHFDIGVPDIDISWHFGHYKKYRQGNFIDVDTFIDRIRSINKMVSNQFILEQKSFVQFVDKMPDNERVLFLRLEKYDTIRQEKHNLPYKYVHLQKSLNGKIKNTDLIVFAPLSCKQYFNSRVFDNVFFVPDNLFAELHKWDNYKQNKLPQNCRDYMVNFFNDIGIELKNQYTLLETK